MWMAQKQLSPTEIITRYLFKGDFFADLQVKPKAMKPAAKDDALSTYRCEAIDLPSCESALTDDEIWKLADKQIGDRNGGVIARSDFAVSHVLNLRAELEVVEDSSEHIRHAHIQPFPRLLGSESVDEKTRIDLNRNTLATRLAHSLKAKRR